jgi:hypothetical protein
VEAVFRTLDWQQPRADPALVVKNENGVTLIDIIDGIGSIMRTREYFTAYSDLCDIARSMCGGVGEVGLGWTSIFKEAEMYTLLKAMDERCSGLLPFGLDSLDSNVKV